MTRRRSRTISRMTMRRTKKLVFLISKSWNLVYRPDPIRILSDPRILIQTGVTEVPVPVVEAL